MSFYGQKRYTNIVCSAVQNVPRNCHFCNNLEDNIVEAPCYGLQYIGELIVNKYVAELINN